MQVMEDSVFGLLNQPLWVFLSVIARLTPVLTLTPPVHGSAVPGRIRVLLTVSLAILLTPIAMTAASSIPPDNVHALIALAGEVLLGLLLACIILLAITSMQIAGQTISHLAGLGMATVTSSDGKGEFSLLANALGWLAVVMLLVAGGHRYLMQCCLKSFTQFPVGTVCFDQGWMLELEQVVAHTLQVGIRLAVPVALALLVSNLVSGIVARTLPQLNLLAIGLSMNTLVLMVLLLVSIGGISWVYQHELTVWIDSCQRIVGID